jgi:hypothetical protein
MIPTPSFSEQLSFRISIPAELQMNPYFASETFTISAKSES